MDLQRFHFIGLGGIGMSALARILLEEGHVVSGSDLAVSSVLTSLQEEGATVFLQHDAAQIQPDHTIIYSSAIHESNPEWQRAAELSLHRLHRSELLDQLMRGKKTALVTGTHGKTTTSALLAFVLAEAGLDPSYVVGGILKNSGRNGKKGRGEWFVAEADESDGSFLKTSPTAAIVLNLEDEHLDYWKTRELLDQGFATFFQQTQNKDLLFWCADDVGLKALNPSGHTYGFSEGSDVRLSRFCQTARGVRYDITWQGKLFPAIEVALFGRHNALNSAAVFALALQMGVSEESIRKAFQAFQGTKRRLEYKGQASKVAIYDDYGHHPTEIAATIAAISDHMPERRLVVFFQPHRYTRVAHLSDEFPPSLAKADLVIMTDIYGANETPIRGVTSRFLYGKLTAHLGQEKVRWIKRDKLVEEGVKLLQPLDVVLTIGAGDITHVGASLLEALHIRKPKLKVALLCGGMSAEHPVSLQSAQHIADELDRSIYDVEIGFVNEQGLWRHGTTLDACLKAPLSRKGALSARTLNWLAASDVVIPAFHGPRGEDGMMQGFCEALLLPYVGCDYRASALCMQKSWTKQVAGVNQIPIVPFIESNRHAYRLDPHALHRYVETTLSYPVWVKAVHLGSSIGVSRAANITELTTAIDLSLSVDDTFIVEREVVGRQIEFAALGNDIVRIAEPCEILSEGQFYDYEKKYGVSAVDVAVPAQLTPEQKQIGLFLAEKAYRAVGCKGFARVDFFLDEQGQYWLNEINPFPGFRPKSAYPLMWLASGMSVPELIDQLIALALHKQRASHVR
ncbi:MAG: bifunctional enzyme MurC/Ddl [Chlamydiota bacterium]